MWSRHAFRVFRGSLSPVEEEGDEEIGEVFDRWKTTDCQSPTPSPSPEPQEPARLSRAGPAPARPRPPSRIPSPAPRAPPSQPCRRPGARSRTRQPRCANGAAGAFPAAAASTTNGHAPCRGAAPAARAAARAP
ncbi:Protein of unknown function [Gryllus bimaculatus]|nr:Protein of unknown function [Gryllus bimaculatus]